MSIVNISPIVDVQYLYSCSDKELFELLVPFDHNIDDRILWFQSVALKLSCPRHRVSTNKIHNIYYSKSKLSTLERIHIEDLARIEIQSRKADNVIQLSFPIREARG